MSNLRSAARHGNGRPLAPGRLCASPLTRSLFGTCRPGAASGWPLALPWRSSTSCRRGRSRRRHSPVSRARCRVSCSPAPSRCLVRPSWQSAPTGRRLPPRRASRTAAISCGSAPLASTGSAPHSRRLLRRRAKPPSKESDCSSRLDLVLVLASRAPVAAVVGPATPSATAPAAPQAGASIAGRGGSSTGSGQGPSTGSGRGRGGFQQLDVVTNATGEPAGAATADEAALRAELQLPPGFSAAAPAESVATAGIQGQSNDALLFGGRGGRGEFGEGGPDGFGRGEAGAGGGDQGGFGGGGRGGGPGGGGPGGFGGGPGGFGGMRGGGRMQGNANYNLGGSMFDAAPYPLNGRVREEPDYVQQRYGSSFGGPLTIPHVFNGGTRTSFFLNYSGNHSRTPVDSYSTVPTLAARAGDFSGTSAVVIDPLTGRPFSDNRIPQSRIDPAAQTLLAFIPQPNAPGETQNFHYVTANSSNSNDVNLRVTHIFGTVPQRGAGGGRGRGGLPGGGRGQPGGPGGFGRGGRGGPQPTRSVLNASVGYRQSSSVSLFDVPDRRRIVWRHRAECARELDALQGPLQQCVDRHLQSQQLDEHQSLRLHHQHRWRRRHRGRVVRSLRLGHSEPVVHDRGRSARSHAFAPRRSADADQQFDDADLGPAYGQVGRRVPVFTARQLVEQQPARQLRLHGVVHVGVGYPRHRPRSCGLPARLRAAGIGPVRTRRAEDEGPRLEPLSPGRLANARQPHAQLRAALRVQSRRTTRRTTTWSTWTSTPISPRPCPSSRAAPVSSPVRCRPASSKPIATTLRRGSVWRGERNRG